jgi:hypothetical protein
MARSREGAGDVMAFRQPNLRVFQDPIVPIGAGKGLLILARMVLIVADSCTDYRIRD